MKETTETRKLPVRLHGAELAQVAAHLAEKTVAREAVQAEKDVADKAWGRTLKAFDDEISALAKLYGEGAEEREVECRREYDVPRNTYRLWRTDTGETVLERAMTAEELEQVRQGDLFKGTPPPEMPPASAIGGPEPTKDEAVNVLVEVAKRAETIKS